MSGGYISGAMQGQINRYIGETKEYRDRLKIMREFDTDVGSVYAASADDLSHSRGIQDWAIIKLNPQRLNSYNDSQKIFNKVGICPYIVYTANHLYLAPMSTKSNETKV